MNYKRKAPLVPKSSQELNLMKDRKLKLERKTSKRSFKTSRARLRMFWKMMEVQNKPCNLWSKWCLSLSRTLIVTQGLISQVHLSVVKANSNKYQQLHQATKVKHFCSKWWKVKVQPCQHRPRRPPLSLIMIHLLLQPALCSMTFSVSRRKKSKINSKPLRVIHQVSLVPICLLAWARVT